MNPSGARVAVGCLEKIGSTGTCPARPPGALFIDTQVVTSHALLSGEHAQVNRSNAEGASGTMFTNHVRQHESVTIDRASVRLSATLLLAGQVLYILVTQFHAGGPANNHSVIFATYAASDSWKVVHVGQFLAMAVIIAGLLVLFSAFDGTARNAAWAARLGASSAAIVALALYAVLQAVDGVGNQEVDRALVSAQEGDESARFAAAEAMRWLEWGARSYHDYALGLALLLFAAAALRAAELPATIAYLMGLSGVAYLVQGWVVGSEGFSGMHTILILMTWVLSLAWMIWLVVATRRTQT